MKSVSYTHLDGAKEAVKTFLTERIYKKEDTFYADPKTGKELDRTGKFFIDPAYGKRCLLYTSRCV